MHLWKLNRSPKGLRESDPRIREEALPAFLAQIVLQPEETPASRANPLPRSSKADVPSQMSTAPAMVRNKESTCKRPNASPSTT